MHGWEKFRLVSQIYHAILQKILFFGYQVKLFLLFFLSVGGLSLSKDDEAIAQANPKPSNQAARLSEQCANRNTKSCLELVDLYLLLDQPQMAQKYAQLACAQDNKSGCMLKATIELESSPTQAIKLLESNCSEDDAASCLILMGLPGSTESAPKETHQKMLKKACQSNEKQEACENLGSILPPDPTPLPTPSSQETLIKKLISGVSKEDLEKWTQQEMESHRVQCYEAVGASCRLLGSFEISKGSLSEGIKRFEMGCRYEDAASCVKMGVYLQETGRKKESVPFFGRASLLYAKQGCAEGRKADCEKLKRKWKASRP